MPIVILAQPTNVERTNEILNKGPFKGKEAIEVLKSSGLLDDRALANLIKQLGQPGPNGEKPGVQLMAGGENIPGLGENAKQVVTICVTHIYATGNPPSPASICSSVSMGGTNPAMVATFNDFVVETTGNTNWTVLHSQAAEYIATQRAERKQVKAQALPSDYNWSAPRGVQVTQIVEDKGTKFPLLRVVFTGASRRVVVNLLAH